MDAQAVLVDAFEQLGLEARLLAGAPHSGSDLVLDLDGVRTCVQIKYRSLVTEEVAGRLLTETDTGDGVLVVVGDRVTETARTVLASGRVGYYDLRGRLVLRTDRIMIDAGNAIADIRLFWQVADRWTAPPAYLARLPSPGDASLTMPLRLGLDDVEHEAGWALADSVAAAAFGAPVAARSGQLLDFYVPDQLVVRRATTLLGAAGSVSAARGAGRVAPVPAVCRRRVDLDTNPTPWPLAHPLFVALDLARDIGRGREILDAWTPQGRWARVW